MDFSKLYMPQTPLEKILKPMGLYDPSRDPMRKRKNMLVSQQMVHDLIYGFPKQNDDYNSDASPPKRRKRKPKYRKNLTNGRVQLSTHLSL